MSKEKKKKVFICPYCKKELNSIGNAQNTTIFYHYDINTEEYQEYDQSCSGGDSEFFCPECDKDISFDELNKQNINI